MQTIDWVLVVLPLLLVLAFAVYTRRFVRSVADFLAGGRCAGRYLLANARGESDAGLANTMSKFEIVLVSGFVLNFWEKVSVPIMLLVGISGFVIYRFRETRAMTLAQFFEMRYSRNFRLYMGLLAFVSGILNYGIFPAVSARFFIYFLRLPEWVSVAGFAVPTMALIMGSYLAVTVYLVLVGGQVTAMVTDCIEGILSHAIYIIIAIAVFFIVDWHQIVHVMADAPPNKSHINPFDAGEIEDFNLWFVLMNLLIYVYTRMALQNKQGFNAAAKSAHESRMGDVLGNWRMYARNLMILLLGVCALTYLNHGHFAQQAAPVHAEIASIGDKYIQKQMTVPITLSHLLPVGIKGLFCAMMIMGLLAGDAGHMHSWGSIFVQDVVLPLRRRPMTPRQHIWALRGAVTFVALFAFAFSLLFTQTQYIALWWAITAMVFTGGAGAAIIGGLYWRRGTTAAAWAATITGSILSGVGIVLGSTLWKPISAWAELAFGLNLPDRFWLNNLQVAFLSACVAATVYVVVSLLTSRHEFDLDRMLHRGAHARAGDGPPVEHLPLRDRFRLRNILKFDANFTFADKLVSGGIFWWAMGLLAVNLVVTVWNLAIHPWPVEWWSRYWLIMGIGLPFAIAVATLFWFGIGGIRDTIEFFHVLKTMTRDASDDGRVPERQPVSPGGFPPIGPTAESDAAAKMPPNVLPATPGTRPAS